MTSNFQKIYTINLITAQIICLVWVGWLILVFLSAVQVDDRVSLLSILILFALFLPLNLLLKFQNKDHKLEIPDFLPKGLIKVLPIITFIVFIVILIYGFLVYLHAPIKPDGDIFTDKDGTIYTYGQYIDFKHWEFAYFISWSIGALQSIVFLPFYDGKTRKWRF